MPFQVDQQMEEDEDDYLDVNSRMGLRVMGLSFSSEMWVLIITSSSTNQMFQLEGGIKIYNLLPVFILHTVIVSVNASRSAYGQCKNNILNFARACCSS